METTRMRMFHTIALAAALTVPGCAGPSKDPTFQQMNALAAAGFARMFVQVAALASRESADRLRTKVAKDLGRPAHVDASVTSGRALHRVRVGPLRSADEADLLVARLELLGLGQARVVMD